MVSHTLPYADFPNPDILVHQDFNAAWLTIEKNVYLKRA
jgi:hypothetical protein